MPTTASTDTPDWIPTPEQIERSNVGWLMRHLGVDSYEAAHRWTVDHREAYWQRVIERIGIRFHQPYQQIVDPSQGVQQARWLVGAQLNIADSCFAAASETPAIVHQTEGGRIETISYGELDALSDRVALNLRRSGFQIGDALAILMPMTADAVVIYLGIIKAGCVAVGIADSFRTPEIATRLRIAQAKGLFTQDVLRRGGKTFPLYKNAVEAGAPKTIVIPAQDQLAVSLPDGCMTGFVGTPRSRLDGRVGACSGEGPIPAVPEPSPRWGSTLPPSREGSIQNPTAKNGKPCHAPLRDGDRSWSDFLEAEGGFESVALPPESPINILFSSGTTGDPKAIPWNQTTPIKCAADGHFHQDIQPGDIVIWPTNLGWMMGPWLIFASLMNRATIGLYSGAPNTREFGEFVQNSGANVVGVIPSLVKTWRTSGCLEGLDWTGVKLFSSTGECSNAADMRWLMAFAGGKPVIEYCGGTELGGSYIGQTLARPIFAGTFNTPILGWDFVILDEAGQECDNGELFLIPPSIGNSVTLLNADHQEIYFAGTPRHPTDGTVLRRHGDQMKRLPGGYWQAQGRADDTMNLGGIKVSSAEIERVLQKVDGVVETAAIALADQGGPSQLVVYAVCTATMPLTQCELQTAMQRAISQQLNPLFKIHDVVQVTALPRTASNKVMRRTLRDQYKAST